MENTILEKLNVIQSKLKAPKGQYNKFGNYAYRSCEDILEALKPLLAQTKTVLTIKDDIEFIGDRYYLRATCTLHDAESGEKIENAAYARETDTKKGMDAAQITGSVSSYARKYALNGLFAIDDNKDSDYTNNGTTQQASNAENKKSLQDYRHEIAQTLKAKGVENKIFIAWLKSNFKTEKLDGLTRTQLEKIKAEIAQW